MGVLEAFLIGGLLVVSPALVLFLVLANTAEGRSTTAFSLPAADPPLVLQLAHAFALQRRMRVTARSDGLVAEEGIVWVTGVRVLEVRVRYRLGGGTDVWLDAYIRAFYPKEMHIDPTSLFGMIPRRKAFALAQGLVAALGAPGAVWEHRRAR